MALALKYPVRYCIIAVLYDCDIKNNDNATIVDIPYIVQL